MSKIANKNEKMKSNHQKDQLSVFGFKVEIVRNFINYPFSNKMPIQHIEIFQDRLIEFIKKKFKDVIIKKIENLSNFELEKLKNLAIINQQTDTKKHIAIIDENSYILINEIDHIKIITSSFVENLSILYKKATEIEKKLSGFSEYSINVKYGYLSPSLNHCGLGLFFSCFMNIPAILKTYSIENLSSLLNERGYNLTLHNFNNEEKSNIILTSKLNYGISEYELFETYCRGIEELTKLENSLSKISFKISDLEDKIFRSYGIIKYAKKMNKEELIDILQNIRLGLKLGLDIPLSIKKLNLIQLIAINTDIEKESFKANIEKENILPLMIKPILEDNNV